MPRTTSVYTLVSHLPDGHSIFVKQDAPGRWLIADESGSTPDATDDGELWLDPTQNLLIGQENHDGRIDTHCFIPLRDGAGESTSTTSNPATLLYLSVTFDWPITVTTSARTFAVRTHVVA